MAILFVLMAGAAFAAENYPSPKGTAVNDFANVIDPDNSAKMESLAHEILQKTGAAIYVVTVPELGPTEEINLYVNGLYKAWGIGKKGEDKGVLIFLAVKERKIRIETGYGVEGVLPDGLVGEIRDKYVVPHLKAGETGKALYNGMLACGAYIAKDAGVQLTGVAGPYRTNVRPENKGFNVVGHYPLLNCRGRTFGNQTRPRDAALDFADAGFQQRSGRWRRRFRRRIWRFRRRHEWRRRSRW
ncbi:MAG: TPM domain-containing protein [Desulfosudis oleivorans]|nr:TPM domain-containing protein [Desulfosudis oleivorans]